MARRRGAGELSEEQLAELGSLARFWIQMPRRSCADERWCPRCSVGWRCWSFFDTEEQFEAGYWVARDGLIEQYRPGGRPWTYWKLEAPGVCRHIPRCALPDSGDKAAWLDRHDQLSGQERTHLALAARDEAARRAAWEEQQRPENHWLGCTCRPCKLRRARIEEGADA